MLRKQISSLAKYESRLNEREEESGCKAALPTTAKIPKNRAIFALYNYLLDNKTTVSTWHETVQPDVRPGFPSTGTCPNNQCCEIIIAPSMGICPQEEGKLNVIAASKGTYLSLCIEAPLDLLFTTMRSQGNSG